MRLRLEPPVPVRLNITTMMCTLCTLTSRSRIRQAIFMSSSFRSTYLPTAVLCVLAWCLSSCSPLWGGQEQWGDPPRSARSRSTPITPTHLDLHALSTDTLSELRRYVDLMWPDLGVQLHDLTDYSSWESSSSLVITIPQTLHGMGVDNTDPDILNQITIGIDSRTGDVWGLWNDWALTEVDTASVMISQTEALFKVKHRFPPLKGDWERKRVQKRVLLSGCHTAGRVVFVFDVPDSSPPGFTLRVYVDAITGSVFHWRTHPQPKTVRFVPPPRRGRASINRASFHQDPSFEMRQAVLSSQPSWW